jgi:tetratricopeptide (TPR) repeat protein
MERRQNLNLRGQFFSLLLLSVSIIIPCRAQETLPEIIKKVQASTVLILTYDEAGKVKAQGSGFFISKNGDIITNRHVLEEASKAEIKVGEGKVYAITGIVAEDKEHDLIRASVDIPLEIVSPIELYCAVPEVGERVIVIGSPLGLEQTVSDGIISAVREIPQFGKIIQITAPLSPGSSGSPVVNMKGEVIGIATFQILEGQNLNFSIPSERIAKLESGKMKTFAEWKSGKTEEWLSSAEGLFVTGLHHAGAEDYEKALSYLERAVKKDPNQAVAYFLMGLCHDALGNYNEAIKAYKQAIRIEPDFAAAQYNLGVAYGKLERHNEAIEAYKQVIRIEPDYEDAYNNLGMEYGIVRRDTDAIEAFKQAIRVQPDYADAYFNLGQLYSFLCRWDDALEAYKKVISLKPDFAEAYFSLGTAYGGLGRYNDSLEAVKEAIRIKPDYANAHFYLGLIYLLMGDKSSALDEYRILKGIDEVSANILFNLIYK